jgi:hypothetical protein
LVPCFQQGQAWWVALLLLFTRRQKRIASIVATYEPESQHIVVMVNLHTLFTLSFCFSLRRNLATGTQLVD